MTPNQFSELITSFNQGAGIPCTIKNFDGEYIEQQQFVPRMQTIQDDFEKRLFEKVDSFINQAKEMRAIAKKGRPSKQDAVDMSLAFDSIVSEFKSNIPYMIECMRETIDKVSVEAKSEVEHWINKRIMDAGMTAIKETTAALSEEGIDVPRGRIE